MLRRLQGRTEATKVFACIEVEEILKQWREPAAVFFRVRASDGRIYVLKRGVGAGARNWSIEPMG